MSAINNIIPAKCKAEQNSFFDRHNISDREVQEKVIEKPKLESTTPESMLANYLANG